jgi:3-phenylpropionate/trans-cinnamate dioxygenase ferredoxin reductase subunit
MLLEPGEREPFAPVPYVWSDQYDLSIRYAGHHAPSDQVHVLEGSFESLQFIACYARDERVTGVISFDMGKAFRKYQRGMEDRVVSLSEARTTSERH